MTIRASPTPPDAVPRLSAVLIVHNEERHLADCLESLRGLADEIIVVDGGSDDRTREIAEAAGARVHIREFDGFGPQKQAALDLARGDWVLSIDADERITPGLREEMRRTIARPDAADGYRMRLRMIYLGTRLRFGPSLGEWKMRLARRERSRFPLISVHEGLIATGRIAKLSGWMDHVKYRTVGEHLRQMDRYTDMVAQQKRGKGARFSALHLVRIPAEIFHQLVFRLGILDGRPGIIHAAMSGYYSFLKYAKLWPEPPRGGS